MVLNNPEWILRGSNPMDVYYFDCLQSERCVFRRRYSNTVASFTHDMFSESSHVNCMFTGSPRCGGFYIDYVGNVEGGSHPNRMYIFDNPSAVISSKRASRRTRLSQTNNNVTIAGSGKRSSARAIETGYLSWKTTPRSINHLRSR